MKVGGGCHESGVEIERPVLRYGAFLIYTGARCCLFVASPVNGRPMPLGDSRPSAGKRRTTGA